MQQPSQKLRKKPKLKKKKPRKQSKPSRARLDWCAFAPPPIIGVDEAGRGCLAGPVVAAAVILSRKIRPNPFRDSKLLSEARREELYSLIVSEHTWAVGFASEEEIDKINILRASLLAMRRAVEGLKRTGGHVLVDGKFVIPDLKGFEQTAVIKGDQRLDNVSAASIVAKVTRDRLMREYAGKFPGYGFEVHKGYGTEQHRLALASLGPCEAHRFTFAGVLPAEVVVESSGAIVTS
ncbi:MAG: ribonuclease HII [Bdellovibrionales bacterium]